MRVPPPRFVILAILLSSGVAGTSTARAADPGALGVALTRLGLENVGVARDSLLRVGFENRRYRHSAEAFGRIARSAAEPCVVFERRAGLPAAEVTWSEDTTSARLRLSDTWGDRAQFPGSATLEPELLTPELHFRVRYPGEPGAQAPPPVLRARTSRSVDLTIGPVFSYELGRIFTPFLYRLDLETMARWNPWPGMVVRGSVLFPGHDDFPPDPQHPDVDLVRPGQLTLDQFHWIPALGLASVTAGYFGDNRYGVSTGFAHPIDEGRLLLDAQADVSGFLAFSNGTEYSRPELWTGFVGVGWRPGLDLTVRLRQGWFLSGDHGAELELVRAMGDFDVAAYTQHTNGDNVVGVRLALPVPPLRRATGARVRIAPIERFRISYHSRSEPVGLSLGGVASREDFLRQLDTPSLDANRDRFRRARGDTPGPSPPRPPASLVSLTGTTGFINTPWAGVMPDRVLEVGMNHVPKRWAYDQRGSHDNDAYYATLGFLPRVEASARWTVIPGLKSFSDIVPDSRLTDSDYMASGRIALLNPREGRPGLAVGIEDAKGTRRFHSTYAVTGMPFHIQDVQGRLTLGYAFHALSATRHTLDGGFGAFELSPWRFVAAQLEYDTEKWNAAIAVPAPHGIRLRAALLHMQSLSVGAGYSHPL
jgi:Exopolysaccharide biosynthesis protein YbjH